MIIEFCCDKESNMGKVGDELGLTVCRLFKEAFDLTKPAIINQVIGYVKDHPGISLWGSLPCTVWCSWQHMNVYKLGDPYRKKLMARRAASMRLFANFVKVAREVRRGGGAKFLLNGQKGQSDGPSPKYPVSSTTSTSQKPSVTAALSG